MKGEYLPAARLGVEMVGETGLDARGFIAEGQRRAGGGKDIRQVRKVLGALLLDADERLPGFLGLDDTHGFIIDEEEVVSSAGG